MGDMGAVALTDYVAERIRTERQRAGLTQSELGGALGLDRQAVADIEAGRRGVSIVQIAGIVTLLGIEPSDVLPPEGWAT